MVLSQDNFSKILLDILGNQKLNTQKSPKSHVLSHKCPFLYSKSRHVNQNLTHISYEYL